jgi:hypothetical protein
MMSLGGSAPVLGRSNGQRFCSLRAFQGYQQSQSYLAAPEDGRARWQYQDPLRRLSVETSFLPTEGSVIYSQIGEKTSEITSLELAF